MHPLLGRPLAAALASLVLCGSLAGQSILREDDVGVVTTDGVFLVRDKLPAVKVADTTVLGGPLTNPAIEWLRGTDAFLVANAATLRRVTITQAAPFLASVTDVTPSFPLPGDAQLRDLDIDPGSELVWLLDRKNQRALALAPPLAAGATPILVVPLPSNVRALSVATRDHPFSLIYAEPDRITRQFLDGATELITLYNFAAGLDVDPQGESKPFFVRPDGNFIGYAAAPGLADTMNIMAAIPFPIVPVVYAPQDVEWDPGTNRAYVLAEGGVNPAAFPSATGPNHVVRFPLVPHAVVPPKIITHPNGSSNITGSQGDLAVVHAPFAFTYPYGPAGPSTTGLEPLLATRWSIPGVPYLGNAFFEFVLEDGPPLAAAFGLVANAPTDVQVLGCHLLVADFAPQFLGFTNAAGKLELPSPISSWAGLVGADFYTQIILFETTGQLASSQGLRLHLEY